MDDPSSSLTPSLTSSRSRWIALRERLAASAKLIAFAAIARFCSIVLFQIPNDFYKYDDWISLLYLPAGVIVALILVGGFSGIIGVIIGSYAYNLLFHTLDSSADSLFALTSGIAMLITLLITRYVMRENDQPFGRWRPFSLFYFIAVSWIYAFWNAVIHQIALGYLNSKIAFDIKAAVSMFFGDFAGALTLLIALNLLTSLYILYRKIKSR